MAWIEEIKRDLHGGMLLVWEDRHPDVPKEKMAKYRELWKKQAQNPPPKSASISIPASPKVTASRTNDCIYLGDTVQSPGNRTDNNGRVCSCRGKWLHGCKLHQECTISEQRVELACCQTCLDYVDSTLPETES